MSGSISPDDPWCQFLPGLHRVLADPVSSDLIPRSFISLDHEQSCAWWDTLRYLLCALLGWRSLPAGLAWWYEAGKPTLDDPCLTLARERWNTRGELDFFAAREWETGGGTGTGMDAAKGAVTDYEPSPGWWREFKRREFASAFGPYGGGYNPLHLGHTAFAGEDRAAGTSTGWHDLTQRRAVLIVSGFGSWRRELRDFGDTLPKLGERSWHVEVFDRRVGFLGRFRQSRVTQLWFQGKHSIHMAGNPVEKSATTAS